MWEPAKGWDMKVRWPERVGGWKLVGWLEQGGRKTGEGAGVAGSGRKYRWKEGEKVEWFTRGGGGCNVGGWGGWYFLTRGEKKSTLIRGE